MKTKPITPYARLLLDVRKFAGCVKYATRKTLWTYPKDRLSDGWALSDLYQRAKAADRLGWDIHLVPEDDGLRVEYRKRPDVPRDWA